MPNCLSCKAIVPTGATVCSCGASVPQSATATTEAEQQIRSLLEQGRKIEAAKLYMSQAGCTLKEAKDAVEAPQLGAGSPRSTEADADMEANVLQLLKDGEKIKAVKLYQDRTGTALADSKRAVEAVAARHGIKGQKAGCSVAVAVAVAVVSAAIGLTAVLIVSAFSQEPVDASARPLHGYPTAIAVDTEDRNGIFVLDSADQGSRQLTSVAEHDLAFDWFLYAMKFSLAQ